MILFAEVVFLIGHQWATGASSSGHHATRSTAAAPASAATSSGSPARLFTDFLWPFEITAALLVLAVVGAVVLARRSGESVEPRARGRGIRGGGLMPVLATTIDAGWYLVLAALIFTIGAAGLLTRRNVLVMFMCVELMLNAVNLTFVTFARELNDIRGQVIVFFILAVAAAEVAVGLAIIVAIFRRRRGATADDLDLLKDPTA